MICLVYHFIPNLLSVFGSMFLITLAVSAVLVTLVTGLRIKEVKNLTRCLHSYESAKM